MPTATSAGKEISDPPPGTAFPAPAAKAAAASSASSGALMRSTGRGSRPRLSPQPVRTAVALNADAEGQPSDVTGAVLRQAQRRLLATTPVDAVRRVRRVLLAATLVRRSRRI